MTSTPTPVSVALLTLGCARNDVDSEELAGRLAADGFNLVDDPEDADTVVVNTCGFVDAAKKDSIDTLLAAADLKESGTSAGRRRGRLPRRSGTARSWPSSLPEADAVLGFDDYQDIVGAAALDPRRREAAPAHPARPPPAPADQPRRAAGGRRRQRRSWAPMSTSRSRDAPRSRRRLDGGPMAPLKLASGCDRRCTFCAIPMFRGSFVSRRPSDVLQEAHWLAGQGVKELFLVSENSTSYGKDLGDLGLLETLLPELTAVDGIERVRVSYLQPAETRPGPGHARSRPRPAWRRTSTCPSSTPVPRSCAACAASATRTASSASSTRSAALAPDAGVRSNVIVGFPGETEEDLQTLCDFLERRPDGRHRRLRLLRRGRHRGGEARRQARRGRDPAPASSTSTTSSSELTSQRAEERIGQHRRGARRGGRPGRHR